MTRIRANCPACGEVDLRPEEIELHVVRPEGDPEGIAEGTVYAFECPTCARYVSKPADERITRRLESGGVTVTHEKATRQKATAVSRGHPETPPGGAPLTYDDLLDLHLLLAREDWFGELIAQLA